MTTAKNSARLSISKIGLGYLALGLLAALIIAMLAAHFSAHREVIPDENSTAERIQPVADLEIAPPPDSTTERGKRAGAFVVHESCRSCHDIGQDGAPKIGDRHAWAPRMNQGLDALVHSVAAGKCGVPRGGSDADDMELARAVVRMIWPRMRL